MLAGHVNHEGDVVMIAMTRTWVLALALVLSLPSGTSALAAGGSSDGGNAALREAQNLIAEQRYEEALTELEAGGCQGREQC